MSNKFYLLFIVISIFINSKFLIAQTWSLNQKGDSLIEISYGSGSNFPQYAALYLKDSYFRLVYDSTASWGTSMILLPGFWTGGNYFQGGCKYQQGPIIFKTISSTKDFVFSIVSKVFCPNFIDTVRIIDTLRIYPPGNKSIRTDVTVSVNGNITLDTNRHGEAFKPIIFSSMHISNDSCDSHMAYVGSHQFNIPSPVIDFSFDWIISPPVSGRVFGLVGGFSKLQPHKTPTVEVNTNNNIFITGLVTRIIDTTKTPHVPDVNADNVSLWAASDSVIHFWHYTITAKDTVIPNEVVFLNNNNPLKFSLSQNFPNPFNPTTNISFSIPSKSLVSIKIFDVLGRAVSTVVSEELQSGSYTRQWNADCIASGIYFYRLQSGSFSETKKLLLIR